VLSLDDVDVHVDEVHDVGGSQAAFMGSLLAG
jgi:hypothetical protein